MIAAWMLYGCAVTVLVCIAARAAERAMERNAWPIRWVWVGAALTAIAIPAVRAFTPLGGASAGDAPSVAGVLRLPALRVAAKARSSSGIADVILLSGWGIASLILLTRTAVRRRRLRQLVQGWRAQQLGDVAVLVADGYGPGVIGVHRARVVIPPWVMTLAPEQRALVVRHEVEHVVAGDALLQEGARWLSALAPWNPGAHYIARRLAAAIEVDCDRRVLRGAAVDARLYGNLLLQVAGRARSATQLAPALSASYSILKRRILAMTTPRRIAPLTMAGSLSVAAVTLLLACSVEGPPEVQGPSKPSSPSADPTLTTVPDVQEMDRAVVTAGSDNAAVEGRAGGAPFFEFQVQEPVRALPNGTVPRFPDILRRAGVEGELLAQFVVDTSGHPEIESFKVLKTTHELFAMAVKQALPGMRYSPARKDGKVVRQLVQQPFAFAIAK